MRARSRARWKARSLRPSIGIFSHTCTAASPIAGTMHSPDGMLRAIVNVMTRMRFCTRNDDIEVRAKGAQPPKGFRPWFELRPEREDSTLICGHWSTLGLKVTERALLIDTGCVWGGALTAARLEDREIIQVPCAEYQAPGEDS